MHEVGARVEYFPGEIVTITAIHNYPYGLRYDAVTDDGVSITSWDGSN